MTPNRTDDKAGQPVAWYATLMPGSSIFKFSQSQKPGYEPLYSAPPDSLAVAQALEEWESTFDCNSPREAYAEMKQAVLAHANAAAARALEAVKKIGRDLQLEPIPEWSQPFRDGYREGISEYVHRINAFALTSAAETRRQVKKRRAARKQAT